AGHLVESCADRTDAPAGKAHGLAVLEPILGPGTGPDNGTRETHTSEHRRANADELLTTIFSVSNHLRALSPTATRSAAQDPARDTAAVGSDIRDRARTAEPPRRAHHPWKSTKVQQQDGVRAGAACC